MTASVCDQNFITKVKGDLVQQFDGNILNAETGEKVVKTKGICKCNQGTRESSDVFTAYLDESPL